ncbi:hypothetical protein [Bradyrhizobium sp. CCBAU 53338]|uniref:hypothetical protein n=1 Tax=Bradyrhizobium sp. CCBAU 53338 TaxID=1325111 RepID=UPI00188C3715|nr:hypothetical protein [Bradyrhizobium sp. CCBAU 53338]QOZ54759.1 hypothetical protein XH90_27800 [Bradyrhizobium sp. CCBAU 53338]
MARFVLAFVFAVVGVSPAAASGCLPLLLRTPSLELRLFADDPDHLLKYAKNDRSKIEQKVTEYLASDPDLLPAIKKLVQLAPDSNRAAIGRGLARAAQHCGPVDPKAVQSIIAFTRNLQDSSVSAGYGSVDSDTAPQLPVQSAPANQPNSLFTGEWNTDLADPFAPIPVPLETPPR